MFGLSRKTEYAVMALARLAQSQYWDGWDGERREQGAFSQGASSQGAASQEAVSARQLAAEDDLPPALLSGVLKQLHHAGLVGSKRGVRGGYHLAVAPDRLRLADVIAAIEGPEPVRLTPCCEQQAMHEQGEHEHEDSHEDGCPIMCRCPITGAVRRLNRRLSAFLQRLTLADLLESEVSEQRSEVSGQH